MLFIVKLSKNNKKIYSFTKKSKISFELKTVYLSGVVINLSWYFIYYKQVLISVCGTVNGVENRIRNIFRTDEQKD